MRYARPSGRENQSGRAIASAVRANDSRAARGMSAQHRSRRERRRNVAAVAIDRDGDRPSLHRDGDGNSIRPRVVHRARQTRARAVRPNSRSFSTSLFLTGAGGTGCARGGGIDSADRLSSRCSHDPGPGQRGVAAGAWLRRCGSARLAPGDQRRAVIGGRRRARRRQLRDPLSGNQALGKRRDDFYQLAVQGKQIVNACGYPRSPSGVTHGVHPRLEALWLAPQGAAIAGASGGARRVRLWRRPDQDQARRGLCRPAGRARSSSLWISRQEPVDPTP